MRYFGITLVLGVTVAQSMNKIMLSGYSSQCMDGSPFGIYFQAATDQNSSKNTVLFFEGGGACFTESSCQERAKTDLGSSKNWPSTRTDSNNVLSLDPSNPFRGWNHVFVPYCTGDTHLGWMTSKDGWDVVFSGAHNVQAALDWVGTHLDVNSTSSNILVSGSSAGGIAALHHADWISTLFSSATVKSSPQGGFFFPMVSIYDAWLIHWYIPPYDDLIGDLWNITNSLDPNCLRDHTDNYSTCFMAYAAYPYVQTPLFLAENMFDSQQIEDELFAPDKASTEPFIRYFGNAMVKNISQVLSHGQTKGFGDGLFLASCYDHVSNLQMKSGTPIVASETNTTLLYRDMLINWWNENKSFPHLAIDSAYHRNGLPANPNCNHFPYFFFECRTKK